VYVLVCAAIHNEMQYIATDGDDAVRLTHNGTLDTGGKDSSYDGGPTVFAVDDAAPVSVQPAAEYWTPPVLWDDWQKMNLDRRHALLEEAEAQRKEDKEPFVSLVPYLNFKWGDISDEAQLAIEGYWKRNAKGALRENKNAKPQYAQYKPFEFADKPSWNPDAIKLRPVSVSTELAAITPPRLRAVALLVYWAGFRGTRWRLHKSEYHQRAQPSLPRYVRCELAASGRIN
jgi:hypothetical protein